MILLVWSGMMLVSELHIVIVLSYSLDEFSWSGFSKAEFI